MIGSVCILRKKMPKAFIQRGDGNWRVIKFLGRFCPYKSYGESDYFGITIAVTKSRSQARLIAKMVRN